MSQVNCGDPKYCRPCKLPNQTTRVEDISLNLRRFMSLITCIPWYHSHQHKPEIDCQYGVIEFIDADPGGKATRNAEQLNGSYACHEYEKYWKYTLRLTVKSFNKLQGDNVEHIIYPMDILADIQDKHAAFPQIREALAAADLSINNFFPISALVKEEDGCCWENQAEMNLEICLKRTVSMAQEQIDAICIQFCDGETICPEPKEDCE